MSSPIILKLEASPPILLTRNKWKRVKAEKDGPVPNGCPVSHFISSPDGVNQYDLDILSKIEISSFNRGKRVFKRSS
jgi:hypothetical protein